MRLRGLRGLRSLRIRRALLIFCGRLDLAARGILRGSAGLGLGRRLSGLLGSVVFGELRGSGRLRRLAALFVVAARGQKHYARRQQGNDDQSFSFHILFPFILLRLFRAILL